MTIDEIINEIENTKNSLEKVAEEWLEDYNTVDEIVTRVNEIFFKQFGYKLCSWIDHKSKKVFFCDMRAEASGRYAVFGNYMLANLCKAWPSDKPFLALYNIEKIYFSVESNSAMQKVVEFADHILVSKAAFYNVKMIKRLIIKAGKSKNTTQFFGETREDALDWLVEE